MGTLHGNTKNVTAQATRAKIDYFKLTLENPIVLSDMEKNALIFPRGIPEDCTKELNVFLLMWKERNKYYAEGKGNRVSETLRGDPRHDDLVNVTSESR
ncbi:hypothetical protein Q7C36_002754 [Tachysurus vachellii]|uniref:Uncharacterized protein n=1 Tax=Tachysurus vachellii TaxID=175792 RepID=A0AA88NYH8_TACVA|nr:hypothetical protein Q7C36_002754 [Tachysurus vachellii]